MHVVLEDYSIGVILRSAFINDGIIHIEDTTVVEELDNHCLLPERICEEDLEV